MGCGSSAPVELTGSETHDELRDLVRRGSVDAAVVCVSNEECDLSLGRKAWGKEPLGVKGANALGEAIGRPTCKAKKLVLAGTRVGFANYVAAGMGMKKFAAGLAANTSIEVLDLSGNELTAASCSGGWLAGCAPAIEFLGFEENELTSAGGAALALGLPALPKLATALLATNELASKGALLLVSALLAKAPALAKLELNGNALDDAALAKLDELLGDRDILGDMDDNDEDLADDDCLDDGGLDGLEAALGAVGI